MKLIKNMLRVGALMILPLATICEASFVGDGQGPEEDLQPSYRYWWSTNPLLNLHLQQQERSNNIIVTSFTNQAAQAADIGPISQNVTIASPSQSMQITGTDGHSYTLYLGPAVSSTQHSDRQH